MSKKVAIIISPNYQDYAEKYLAECAGSLAVQDYAGEMKIFITDNESTEKSFEYLKKIFESKIPLTSFTKGGEDTRRGGASKGVEIIRNEKNDGFAKGNNDAIKLALQQGFDYFFLLNMDTVVEPNCISELVKVLEKQPPLPPLSRGKIGAVQARLMLWPEKEKINSLGNVTHFLGFGYCKGYNEKIGNWKLEIGNYPEICYPSGAAVLFTREALGKVGLFDEKFWMYNEDQDLGWRLWLAGFKCVLAPEAVVYHKYEFSRSIKKYYWMDRNRILAILKNYHWLSLVLIFPALVIMELGLLFFSFTNGWFKEKINVYKYFLSFKNWQYIFKARKETQAIRMVKDSDIIKMFSGKIWYQEINSPLLKFANLFLNIYWQIVKFIIIW